MISLEVTESASKYLDRYWAKGLLGMESIAINRLAPNATRYMQANAPWQDRTGNARAGLKATYQRDRSNEEFTIALSHSVDYGIHLELGMQGRFAILRPTANALFPQMVDDYRKVWVDAR